VASTGMMGGGHAQYICLREDSVVTLKPESLSWQEAVAIPFGANTALVFLQDCARLEAGQTVLIIGASGSVGSAAVQLAKHLGATVTAVCSGANAELVKSLGADQVVDYTREDFTALPATYDIVFDVVGASSFAQCQAVLNPRGVFLPCILSLSDMMWIPWTAVRPGKRIRGSVAMQDVGRLQLILGLADIGVLRPVIDRTYLLDDIAEAFKYVELGHKRGNVVITVVHS
ncbi:MAG TPA: NAD(P)-dependent alcohol dehydrogenase, partial [bacterium]|nr:NAD(P)-dependent alcohol dehydrogenase [bacterium]